MTTPRIDISCAFIDITGDPTRPHVQVFRVDLSHRGMSLFKKLKRSRQPVAQSVQSRLSSGAGLNPDVRPKGALCSAESESIGS